MGTSASAQRTANCYQEVEREIDFCRMLRDLYHKNKEPFSLERQPGRKGEVFLFLFFFKIHLDLSWNFQQLPYVDNRISYLLTLFLSPSRKVCCAVKDVQRKGGLSQCVCSGFGSTRDEPVHRLPPPAGTFSLRLLSPHSDSHLVQLLVSFSHNLQNTFWKVILMMCFVS